MATFWTRQHPEAHQHSRRGNILKRGNILDAPTFWTRQHYERGDTLKFGNILPNTDHHRRHVRHQCWTRGCTGGCNFGTIGEFSADSLIISEDTSEARRALNTPKRRLPARAVAVSYLEISTTASATCRPTATTNSATAWARRGLSTSGHGERHQDLLQYRPRLGRRRPRLPGDVQLAPTPLALLHSWTTATCTLTSRTAVAGSAVTNRRCLCSTTRPGHGDHRHFAQAELEA